MVSPKVFISYSHDSPEHEAEVLLLANRLRGDGIDVLLDQYESFPPRGWIYWMKQQIRDTQFILVVCTEKYRRRWDGDGDATVGLGATYESQLIQQLLYDAGGVNERFLPLLLRAEDGQHIPLELRKYTYFPVHSERGYEALYRLLSKQPKIAKPILGHALPPRPAKSDFRNLVWNVPPRNPFFTSRTAQLAAIRRAFIQTSSTALRQPLAISGLGGIGKTQSAVEYAHRYRSEYRFVLWTGADSYDALLSGFVAFAHLLNLPQKGEQDLSVVATAVRRWLESNQEWLLILDNVEDLSLVRQFAPPDAAGHLLITTRLRAAGEYAEIVELKSMRPDEGALFLLRRAKVIPKDGPIEAAIKFDRHLAEQIAAEMDGLPLALDQAGAFIEEAPSTLKEYLDLYRAEGSALRARRGKLAPNHPSVTVTFSLAFARLEQANHAAADLVRSCAFLAPDAIPEELFSRNENEDDSNANFAVGPLAWIETVEEAGRFALIRRDSDNRTLHIHRLVQEVVNDEMTSEIRRHWAQQTVDALSKIFPEPEFRNWSQCERLLQHANRAVVLVEKFGLRSAAAARLLNNVGLYLADRAQYSGAEPLYCRALAINEKALGPEHPDVAGTLINLAALYQDQGRYTDAEPLYGHALAICEKTLGPDHPSTANCLNNLAELYRDQSRDSDAEPLYCRALAIREKALGPKHHETSISLNNLALLYGDQGRYAEAEALHRRTLAIREEILGPDHPGTATSLDNLALLYGYQGRYSDAILLCGRALIIEEKALGPDHPEIAVTLNNLAFYHDRQGQSAEAEPLYRRALAIYERALGPDHPLTANSLNNLAEIYRNNRRFSEAEPLYRRALAIREKALGLENPDTALTLNNLALLYRDQGQHGEAEPLVRRALAVFEKEVGPDHPLTANSLNNLAEIYRNQMRFSEAERLHRRALTIREKVLGPEHPDTATTLNNLALLYRDQGQSGEAEPLFRRAFSVFEKTVGPDHPLTANSLRNYYELLRTLGRETEASNLKALGE